MFPFITSPLGCAGSSSGSRERRDGDPGGPPPRLSIRASASEWLNYASTEHGDATDPTAHEAGY